VVMAYALTEKRDSYMPCEAMALSPKLNDVTMTPVRVSFGVPALTLRTMIGCLVILLPFIFVTGKLSSFNLGGCAHTI